MLIVTVVVWDLVVRINGIQPYILPGPGLVLSTLVSDWSILWSSLLATLLTTVQGLVLAVVGGIGLAILFNQSRLIEHSPSSAPPASSGEQPTCHCTNTSVPTATATR